MNCVRIAFQGVNEVFPIHSTFLTGFDKFCQGNVHKVYWVIVRYLLWILWVKIPSAFCQAKRCFRNSGVCACACVCVFAFVCIKLLFCLNTNTNIDASASCFDLFIPRKELLVSTGEEDRCFPNPVQTYFRKKKNHSPVENQNNVNQPLALPFTDRYILI